MTEQADIVPDSEQRGLVRMLPARVRPYVVLMRLDRLIGAWLLFWPGAWAVALAGLGRHGVALILWLALGAVAMRGAGCVYNDILDRDLDRQVERTRRRPLASGRVSLLSAWALLGGLSLIGLVVLLQLRPAAQVVALASLAPVALYPLMKRVTHWPQIGMGIVFSWAALVGWAAVTGEIGPTALLLYVGAVCWGTGYDTIYALQDREDDALVGIRSSALALGRHVRAGIGAFYLAALLLWAGAIWTMRPDALGLAALLPVALHLGWQVVALRPADGGDALAKFRSNRLAGLLMFLACLVIGTSA
ncbi:MAG TPA: 4-hydroxybenzoate octaprenyltransferase [Allosphingosinicella sp.]|nr:4-hydroxybenzoate octaprenyltransferase [Allosphingosinicella sp.]